VKTLQSIVSISPGKVHHANLEYIMLMILNLLFKTYLTSICSLHLGLSHISVMSALP